MKCIKMMLVLCLVGCANFNKKNRSLSSSATSICKGSAEVVVAVSDLDCVVGELKNKVNLSGTFHHLVNDYGLVCVDNEADVPNVKSANAYCSLDERRALRDNSRIRTFPHFEFIDYKAGKKIKIKNKIYFKKGMTMVVYSGTDGVNNEYNFCHLTYNKDYFYDSSKNIISFPENMTTSCDMPISNIVLRYFEHDETDKFISKYGDVMSDKALNLLLTSKEKKPCIFEHVDDDLVTLAIIYEGNSKYIYHKNKTYPQDIYIVKENRCISNTKK